MKTNNKIIWTTIGAVILVVLVLGYNKWQTQSYMAEQQKIASQGSKSQKEKLISVEVIKAVPKEHQVILNAYGEVSAHYSLTLTSEVSGKVVSISPNFATGHAVKKGEVLAKIEDSAYQEALYSAKTNLASAQQSLLEEANQARQAQKEWKRSGLKGNPSALVLRKPQLKVAQTKVEYYKKAVQAAQYNLQQTQIKAPFGGIITSRNIQLGAVIQSSTTIASLESSDYAEVRILLSDKKWKGLPHYTNAQLQEQPDLWKAQLINDNGSWSGVISRIEQHIDTDSRQRALIVKINRPLAQKTPLYSGSFVTAKIQGTHFKNIWKLPVSVLFQGQYVWYVDSQDVLKKQKVSVVFSQGENLYIQPFTSQTISIVLSPLNYFVEGKKVQIKEEKLGITDPQVTAQDKDTSHE